MKRKENPSHPVLRGVARFVLISLIVTVLVLCLVILAFSMYVQKNVEKTVDESIFTIVGTDSSTELYYYDRNYETDQWETKKLTTESLYGGYHCIYVDYDQIPKDLIHAFVSIEDKRFFQHEGVDWKRTVSALALAALQSPNS